MKLYISLLIFFCSIWLSISQNDDYTCNHESDASGDLETGFIPYRDLTYPNTSFCVKIHVHVIRRDDQTGGQSALDVNQALSYLDTSFNPMNIYFDWDQTINYIDDTSWYNQPSLADAELYNHNDGVDIFMFDDDINLPPFYIQGGGSAIIELTSLFVAGYFIGDDELQFSVVKSNVLTHEMGHIFNLWHTHHGQNPSSGDPNACPEFVNGTNASICGDYIIDTPADPSIGFYGVNLQTCDWLGSGVDQNGDPYAPDTENIMSYTHPGCMLNFTIKQENRMKSAIINIPDLQGIYTTSNTFGNPCNPSTLEFYPNSADDELNLDLRDKPLDTYLYEVYDNMGVLVLSGQSQNILKTLNTSGLQDGLYFLHFYENGELIVKQLVIDHN